MDRSSSFKRLIVVFAIGVGLCSSVVFAAQRWRGTVVLDESPDGRLGQMWETVLVDLLRQANFEVVHKRMLPGRGLSGARRPVFFLETTTLEINEEGRIRAVVGLTFQGQTSFHSVDGAPRSWNSSLPAASKMLLEGAADTSEEKSLLDAASQCADWIVEQQRSKR